MTTRETPSAIQKSRDSLAQGFLKLMTDYETLQAAYDEVVDDRDRLKELLNTLTGTPTTPTDDTINP
jgi:hypothetical protein